MSVGRRYFWDNYSNEELLKLRFSELSVNGNGHFLTPLINQLKKELKRKGLNINPTFWFSTEWFCPDGCTGVALPFYLAHPRLIELEKNRIGYAEGETKEWCLKLLRHELGHVIDNCFQLRQNRERRLAFGNSSIPYPSYYDFRPYSKNYVKHIEDGYAQVHPTEDFAETFAVWLDPKSNWKEKYADWPVIKKLHFMDGLMKSLAGKRPLANKKFQQDNIQDLRTTLKSHYNRKCNHLGINDDHFWDTSLKKIFSSKTKHHTPAHKIISKYQDELSSSISMQTGERVYRIKQMIDSVKTRSKQLDLYLSKKELATKEDMSYYLTKKTNSYIREGRHLTAL